MPTYYGFSTIDTDMPRQIVRTGIDGGVGTITQQPYLGKKFRLTDEQLVLRDFLNSFNIKQGDKVGQPAYGTNIWDYVFDPNVGETLNAVEDEVRRLATLDSRIILNTVTAYAHENGILIEVQMAFRPFNNAVSFGMYLNRSTGAAEFVSTS